jgi:hypothetical protein
VADQVQGLAVLPPLLDPFVTETLGNAGHDPGLAGIVTVVRSALIVVKGGIDVDKVGVLVSPVPKCTNRRGFDKTPTIQT